MIATCIELAIIAKHRYVTNVKVQLKNIGIGMDGYRLQLDSQQKMYSSQGNYLQLDKCLTWARLIHCIEVKIFLFAKY